MTATHLQPARLVEQTTSALPTLVATTDCGEVSGRAPHEMATLRFAAHRLAAFFGGEDIGPDSGLVGVGVYWIPSSTLSRSAAATHGIADEMQLWGGIVGTPFIATKLVSHPRLSCRAAVPAGWIDVTGLEECTLPGWSAFGQDDILAAGLDLLGGGDVRLKCPSERGGHGQHVVHGKDDLEQWLGAIPPQVLREGVVLERDLKESVTYSVGFSAFPGGHRIAYVGTQRNVTTAAGDEVYGGSRLTVVRGGWAELKTSVDDDTISAAVRAAIRYDSAIREAYGVVASRCNYDVIAGVDEAGRRHLGVLEQSWRFGGASMAELLAIERFAAHPALQRVTAETVETYTDEPIPEAACSTGRAVRVRRASTHGSWKRQARRVGSRADQLMPERRRCLSSRTFSAAIAPRAPTIISVIHPIRMSVYTRCTAFSLKPWSAPSTRRRVSVLAEQNARA